MPPQGGGGGRALPKFGEWDVNNPESAEGFTVIFDKARDQKKSSGSAVNRAPGNATNNNYSAYGKRASNKDKKPTKSKSWACCFHGACRNETQQNR